MSDQKIPKKRKNDEEKDTEKQINKSHLPKFVIKPGHQHRSISELPNLLLWIFSETSGKMPSWIFVQVRFSQNKHLITKIIIIFLPGLDAATLKSNSESAPFLNSLISQSSFTYLHNKSNTSYLSLFSNNKKPEKIRVTLEDYLLTQEELIENNFIFNEDFKKTKKNLVQKGLSLVSIDCEMVKCESSSELARVTLINSNFEVIYDKLVKPSFKIIDYLTQYSGITEEILENVTLTWETAREEILDLISSDSIICGHSVENDLNHLKIRHDRVIDTSVMFKHPCTGFKHSLKTLASKYLKKIIQTVSKNQNCHDSIEDASIALELVLTKIEKGPWFGRPTESNTSFVEILENENKTVKIVENLENIEKEVEKNESKVLVWNLTDIENDFDFEHREQRIRSVLENWDAMLKEFLQDLDPGCGVIIASGSGDHRMAEL